MRLIWIKIGTLGCRNRLGGEAGMDVEIRKISAASLTVFRGIGYSRQLLPMHVQGKYYCQIKQLSRPASGMIARSNSLGEFSGAEEISATGL